MFVFMDDGHKIEIRLFPEQTILYDSKEVSKKTIALENKHIFSVENNDRRLSYEVTVALKAARKHGVVHLINPYGISCEFHLVYDVRRDGVTLYSSNFSYTNDTYQINCLSGNNKLAASIKGHREVIVSVNDAVVSKIALKGGLILQAVGTMPPVDHAFKVVEDGKEVGYRLKISSGFTCEIWREGTLIMAQDVSAASGNVRDNMKLLSLAGKGGLS